MTVFMALSPPVLDFGRWHFHEMPNASWRRRG
jgi:hypothetical protein